MAEYYRTNFFMKDKYNYSITELEDMLPYEREAYMMMVAEQEELKKANSA